ncbi:hypothetical protein F2P81_009914 [Scophthalmus maximus]|uniref:Uncharacterized protein n=1 Tax=Scophthalmus maximus TaxID=52904 RepID=A0A6A4SYY8_SCOMX|nr:hypothetical protein F2P81_009914 [Scophthalmus maximus]
MTKLFRSRGLKFSVAKIPSPPRRGTICSFNMTRKSSDMVVMDLVGVTWGARIHPRTETGRRGATPFGRAVNLRSAGGKTPHGQEAKSEFHASTKLDEKNDITLVKLELLHTESGSAKPVKLHSHLTLKKSQIPTVHVSAPSPGRNSATDNLAPYQHTFTSSPP